MSKFLRALLFTAAATGVAALLLRALDLESVDVPSRGSGLSDLDPDDLSEEDVEALMKELAGQLRF